MYCTNFILSQDAAVSAVRNKNIIDLISMHLSIGPINIYIYYTLHNQIFKPYQTINAHALCKYKQAKSL